MLEFMLEYTRHRTSCKTVLNKGSNLYSLYSTKEQGAWEAADSHHLTAPEFTLGGAQKCKINSFLRRGSGSTSDWLQRLMAMESLAPLKLAWEKPQGTGNTGISCSASPGFFVLDHILCSCRHSHTLPSDFCVTYRVLDERVKWCRHTPSQALASACFVMNASSFHLPTTKTHYDFNLLG